MLEARSVDSSKTVMTELVLPIHTNALGSIFGGVVMSWIDICAAISAQRHAQLSVVTASVDELNFIAPIHLGWVVNLKSSVNFVSKTSMEVGVRVDAENPRTGQTVHTTSAYLTFVALDENFKPMIIAPVEPHSVEEKRRFKAAQKRREHRLMMRAQK
jgi:acyl-CoA hydrolase